MGGRWYFILLCVALSAHIASCEETNDDKSVEDVEDVIGNKADYDVDEFKMNEEVTEEEMKDENDPRCWSCIHRSYSRRGYGKKEVDAETGGEVEDSYMGRFASRRRSSIRRRRWGK